MRIVQSNVSRTILMTIMMRVYSKQWELWNARTIWSTCPKHPFLQRFHQFRPILRLALPWILQRGYKDMILLNCIGKQISGYRIYLEYICMFHNNTWDIYIFTFVDICACMYATSIYGIHDISTDPSLAHLHWSDDSFTGNGRLDADWVPSSGPASWGGGRSVG